MQRVRDTQQQYRVSLPFLPALHDHNPFVDRPVQK